MEYNNKRQTNIRHLSDLLNYVYSIAMDVESVVEIRRFELSILS